MADTNENLSPSVLVEINVFWPGTDGLYFETVEVPREKWDAMTRHERAQYCEDLAEEIGSGMVGWGWHIYDWDDYSSTEEPK